MHGRLPLVALILVLPVVILGTVIRIEMNSVGLYLRGFDTFAVSERTGIVEQDLQSIPVHLIRYFNGLEDSAQMEVRKADGETIALFHDYELIHLDDVRKLFSLNSLAQSLGLLFLALLAGMATRDSSPHKAQDILEGLRIGSSLILFSLIALGVLFATQFDRMFVGFHMLAFTNEFWLLDPRTDYLVMLFPTSFWQEMFFMAGGLTGFFAMAILLAATLLGRRSAHATPDRHLERGRDV